MNGWVRWPVGDRRAKLGSWHRLESEHQTACGFLVGPGREVGTPPPGAKTCRFCELVAAVNVTSVRADL